jgi:hypothetical protein
VRAPIHDLHRMAGLAKRRGEGAAQTARTHDADLHRI